MNYTELLEHSYHMAADDECPPTCRLDWLGQHLFDFTTYDRDISELFARKAVEVCAAITNRETFEYIADPENYRWYLLMCNMPFFAPRLTWGTSIRGAWWVSMPVDSCGLWAGNEQVLALEFSGDQWDTFIRAVVGFAADDATKEADDGR